MNVMSVFEQGDAVLSLVFLLLSSMSMVSWYLIFWKGLTVRRERISLSHFRQRFTGAADWAALSMSSGEMEGSVGRLLRETKALELTLAHYAPAQRKELLALHLPQYLENIRGEFDKGLTILASIGSSAPFIGLFGTVWGIYGALMRIAAEGNSSLPVVAGPMGEALVATAFGLFAAIPAVLAYNAFVRINRLLVQDLRHIAEQLATYLSFEETPSLHLAKGSR